MRTISVLVALITVAGCDKIYGVGGRVESDAAIDAPPTYVQEVLADSPTSYYRLDERSGVVCADLAGTIDGTYGGSYMLGAPGALFGDPSTAVMFVPPSSGVLFGDVHELTGVSAFTLEAWVNIATHTHFNNVIAKYEQPPLATGYILYTGYGQVSVARSVDEETQSLVQYDNFETNRFVHVVGTYDGTMLRLYVDGVMRGEKPSALVLPDRDVAFTIGSGNGSISSSVAEGVIDEVAIYPHALSPERVYAHFAAGTALPNQVRSLLH